MTEQWSQKPKDIVKGKEGLVKSNKISGIYREPWSPM